MDDFGGDSEIGSSKEKVRMGGSAKVSRAWSGMGVEVELTKQRNAVFRI